MLDHDRHIRFEHRRVIGIAGNRSRILEVVEAQMQRAARRNSDVVGSDRFAVREKDGDPDVRVLVAGIQQARGLV